MDFKPIFRKVFFTGAGLLLLVLVIMPHLLAPMAQWGLQRFLASRPGLGPLKVAVRHIGISGATVGPICMGSRVVADTVTVDYPFASLIRGRPGRLHVSGLDIGIALTDDGIVFPDLVSLVSDKSAPSSPLPSSSPLSATDRSMQDLLRHFPSRVDLTHSRIILAFNGGKMEIPVEMSALTSSEKQGVWVDFHLSPLDLSLHGVALMKQPGMPAHFELVAKGIDHERFNALLHGWFPGVSLREKGDLRLTGKEDGTWTLTLSHVALGAPYDIALDNLKVTAGMGHGTENGPLPVHARFAFRLHRNTMPPLLLAGSFDFIREDGWQLKMTNQDQETREQFFRIGDMEVTLGRGNRFQLDLGGKGKKGKMRTQLAVADLGIGNMPLPLKVSHLVVNGEGPFDFSPRGTGLSLKMATTVGGVEGDNGKFQVRFPGGSLPLALRVDRNGLAAVTGTVKTRDGRITRQGSDSLVISGIGLNLPFSWPMGPADGSGAFWGENFSFKGHPMGAFRGDITQTARGIDLSGTVAFGFPTLPSAAGKTVDRCAPASPCVRFDLALPLLSLPPSTMKLTWEVPPFSMTHEQVQGTGLVPSEVVLPSFSAILSARGSVVLEKGRWQNELKLDLNHGEVAMADSAFEIKGINASLVFNELPLLRSAPGIILTMDSLRFNKMVATDAEIRYTIESETDLLLEKAAFNWCGGEVTTGATRFSRDIDAYHLRLFCHQLRFADLLQQVGTFKAEGEGSLNGQIPVSWVRGDLTFDNGFLYSTPGLGGTIRVSNTELLTAGIPANTPQFGQMDLAREALKNYAYKWARVGFNSQGEDLLVKLEFDGTPGNVLPFEYKREIGGFVRVKGAGPGSRFQGIKLDVNLNLPFNRVWKLGRQLNQLFGEKEE